eukprot:TRINITY_DN1436_c0_g1_i8.p2 TRINITY_DN1436_c0_g1~~TRINITY_DN1436_c0_g1_i8.p2  ORF type:complete len:73 (-),score=10.97 TRINITY_DN1436_c0_g1_i8:216-434(-)
MENFPDLMVYTIKFGDDEHNQILIDMANIGNGKFNQSIDSLKLEDYFCAIADSLGGQKVGLFVYLDGIHRTS